MKHLTYHIFKAGISAALAASIVSTPAQATQPSDSAAPLSRWIQVQGKVTYLPRIALPRGAKLTVKIQDVSRADASAKLIASRIYRISGVPRSFALRIPRNSALRENALALRAEIRESRGTLWWTTTSHIGVMQNPFSNYVDVGQIVLQAAR